MDVSGDALRIGSRGLGAVSSIKSDTWCPALGSVCGINPPFPFVSSRRFRDPHRLKKALAEALKPRTRARPSSSLIFAGVSTLRASCSFGCIAARYRLLCCAGVRHLRQRRTWIECRPDAVEKTTTLAGRRRNSAILACLERVERLLSRRPTLFLILASDRDALLGRC